MRSATRFGGVAVLACTLGVIAGAGCGKKAGQAQGAPNCEAPSKRTKQHFARFCGAWDSALQVDGARLGRLKLAVADLPPVSTLPAAPLAVLGPGTLLLDGKPSRTWAAHWPPLPRPTTSASPPPPPPPPKGDKHRPGEGAGMLGVLSGMNQKLGSMFSKDGAVAAAEQDALGALMGHTVGDESGLGGLGLGGGDPSQVRVGRELVALLRRARERRKADELLLAIAPDTPAKQVVTLNHKPTESCLRSAVRRWRFPKPDKPGWARVIQPFHFKPKG